MAAIYQWFVNVEFTLTTTLYPITDINSVRVSTSFYDGIMAPIPNDSFEFSNIALIYGSMSQVLVETPPEDESFQFSGILLQGGSLESALVASVPPDEYLAFTNIALMSGSLAPFLITVDSPDEKLNVGCAFQPTGSSMTPI